MSEAPLIWKDGKAIPMTEELKLEMLAEAKQRSDRENNPDPSNATYSALSAKDRKRLLKQAWRVRSPGKFPVPILIPIIPLFMLAFVSSAFCIPLGILSICLVYAFIDGLNG